jgi:hypothetical protein
MLGLMNQWAYDANAHLLVNICKLLQGVRQLSPPALILGEYASYLLFKGFLIGKAFYQPISGEHSRK